MKKILLASFCVAFLFFSNYMMVFDNININKERIINSNDNYFDSFVKTIVRRIDFSSEETVCQTIEKFVNNSFTNNVEDGIDVLPYDGGERVSYLRRGCYYSEVYTLSEPFNVKFRFKKQIPFSEIISNSYKAITVYSILFLISAGIYILLIVMYSKERKIILRKVDYVNKISHDIKTPLTVVKSGLDSLRLKNTDEESLKILDICDTKIESISDKIYSILNSPEK